MALLAAAGLLLRMLAAGAATVENLPGCFVDTGPVGSGQKGRQMVHQVCEVSGMCSGLTRERCAQACRALNYTLFGVEAGHQCYCDNKIAHPGALLPSGSTHCNKPCSGAKRCVGAEHETCGASNQLWVEEVHGVPLPVNCTPAPPPAPQIPVGVQPTEPRNIVSGTTMFKTGYLDQPYCVENPVNDEWTCTTTAGGVHEGGGDEHMISQVSSDQVLAAISPGFD